MKSDFESGVFGKEKDGSFESAVTQISKGFGEEDFYPTLEEKGSYATLPDCEEPWFRGWQQKNCCSLLSSLFAVE